jgi:DNA-binding IclR family transcriptional regulator
MQPSRQGTQTATRSLGMLFVVAASPDPLALRDIAATMGIAKSAAQRLLGELVRQSLLMRTPDNRYGVGPSLVALAAQVLQDDALRVAARPVLDALVERTSETVSLYIRSVNQRVCIDSRESPHPIRRAVPLGRTSPLFVGPTGKVILAYLPSAEREIILAEAEAAGENVSLIRSQLGQIAENGYMAAVGDRIPGVGGLSFALLKDRVVIAAITVSGPADRWSVASMHAALPGIVQDTQVLRSWSTSLKRPQRIAS